MSPSFLEDSVTLLWRELEEGVHQPIAEYLHSCCDATFELTGKILGVHRDVSRSAQYLVDNELSLLQDASADNVTCDALVSLLFGPGKSRAVLGSRRFTPEIHSRIRCHVKTAFHLSVHGALTFREPIMNPNKEKVKRARDIDRILTRLFPDASMVLRYRTPWECMVAVQLSAQCTDKKVNEVTVRLFKKYRSLADYIDADPHVFERDIYQTGFYRNKTKNILAAAKMVQSVWRGKLPRTMEEMLRIPGVARKTANVVLGNVYGVVEGIAVDTHVYRLSRQWGLSRATNAEKVEQDLMALFPKKDWFALTYRIIEYGRAYSPAKKKDHSDEPLAGFYL